MTRTFCVSCSEEWAKHIEEKNLSPSKCFVTGIKAEISEPMPYFKGETIEKETLLSKKTQQVTVMQGCIDDLNKQLEETKNVLEKEKNR